jgi:circadian clock protein KaiC
MAEFSELPRVATGIPGLDLVLAGGFFETGVYIIEGPAGAGKTIIANQICFHQSSLGKSAVYYTLLTEAHDRMLGFIRTLGFYDPTAIPNRMTYVSGFKVLEAEGLPGVLRSMRDIVSSRRASLLVVDGVVSAEEVAPSDTAFKKFIHEVQAISAMYRCTVILLTNTETAKRRQAEHTMVDGIIEIDASVVRLKPQRTISVRKFRGAAQLRGDHTLSLSDQGAAVLPRFETIISRSPIVTAGKWEERKAFGISKLDALMHGGAPAASNTLVFGPSGVGKTILGLHFAAAGLAAGENALIFTFYEQPSILLEKAARLGIDLAGPFEKGRLKIVWQSSVEANLDGVGASLLAAFSQHRPARIFIDSMQGFQVTVDPQERVQDFFAAISEFFVSHGVTLLINAESPDLVGPSAIRVPFTNASRMCQNILLLRHCELHGKIRKVFAILKMRDSGFDPSLHIVDIGDRGFALGAPISDADGILGGRPSHRNIDDDAQGR